MRIREQQAAMAARNMGPEIELLRSFGVSAKRISDLLDESAANIRKISERAQHPDPISLEVPAPPIRQAQLKEFLLYGQRRKTLEAQEWEVEKIFDAYASTYQFEEGARILN